MPKIENEQIYPLENEPKFTDKVIGTDDGLNKTKNFSLLSISNLIGRLNNNQFKYFGSITPVHNYFTQGAFFTDTNFNVAGSFERLIVNKDSNQPKDISAYLNKLKTIPNLQLKLVNANNVENFFLFKVDSITNENDYFFINVTLINNFFLGSLNHLDSYDFIFGIQESATITQNNNSYFPGGW